MFGLLLAFAGYLAKNDATVLLNQAFIFFLVICLFCIHKLNIFAAKIIWGLCTPILIFSSPCLFTLSQPVAVFIDNLLYFGGVLLAVYSFQKKDKKHYMWLSIGFFLRNFIL